MFKVFDTKEKLWIKEGILLSPNNDLNQIKKSIFGNNKLFLIPNHRYAIVQDIGLEDMRGNLIYEGDILSDEKDNIIGLVVYIPNEASFVLLDYRTDTYYYLGTDICKNKFIIIGNNFENADLLDKGYNYVK